MEDGAEPAGVLAGAWNRLRTVVAPATLVTALLFYFGYVSARAQFGYFGVDVDTIGLSTQEFVMRAPQPLLVPALLLLVGSAAITWANAVLRRRLEVLSDDEVRRALLALGWVGAAVLTVGLVLLLAYTALGDWPLYPLVTPLVLGAGAGLLAVASSLSPTGRSAPAPSGVGRTTAVLLVLVVVACLFWATATIAQWSGTGRAKALARDLTVLPAVVLDTADPLFAGDEAVRETAFPAEEGQAFRYRYRGLRLLAEGEGRLFLVPERWSPSGSTFVVGFDEARVRFRFVNDPPGTAS